MNSIKDANYYFITDEGIGLSPEEQVEIAVNTGVKIVQYRRKDAPGKVLYEEASRISDICKDKALFIVNDRVDIAQAVDADGVHLGQDDLPYEVARELVGNMILGISTHNLKQALKAERVADYIGIGPVHSTQTKQDRWKELRVEGALEIAERVNVPTTAIGGIGYDDLEPLSRSFDMVCAISSVTRTENLSESVGKFETSFKKFKRNRS